MHCMGIMNETLLQLPPVDIEKLSPPLQSDMIRDDAPEKQDDKTNIMVVSKHVLSNSKHPHEASFRFDDEHRSAEMVSLTITCVDRYPKLAELEPSTTTALQFQITADILGHVFTTTNAPLQLHPPPKWQRYSSLPPNLQISSI